MDAFIAEERPAPGRRAASWSAIEAAIEARRWRASWGWLAVLGLGLLCGLSLHASAG